MDVRGFGLLSGGVATSVPFLTAAILTPVGGGVADVLSRRLGRLSGRRWTVAIGVSLAAGFLAIGATASSVYLALAALSLSVGFAEFTEGAYWATASEISVPHAGTACGILNTFGNLGGVASTLIVPWLVQAFGWPIALGTGSLLAVAAGALWAGVKLDEPRRVAPIVQADCSAPSGHT